METLPSRVFNNGNSQAVRIPAEFRLDTDRVSITRNDAEIASKTSITRNQYRGHIIGKITVQPLIKGNKSRIG